MNTKRFYLSQPANLKTARESMFDSEVVGGGDYDIVERALRWAVSEWLKQPETCCIAPKDIAEVISSIRDELLDEETNKLN